MAVDPRRRQLYTVSSNCDTDNDPTTPPPPVTPPLEEAIISLTLDGDLAWAWRPREVDPDDLDFGAVPNLFEAEIGGALRDVVGVGGKDGTYYVLDRDGVNEITGTIEPYWQTNVVPGGPIGGIIGAASVGEGDRRLQHRLRLQHQPSAEALGARAQSRATAASAGRTRASTPSLRALHGRAGSGAVRRHAAAEHQHLRSRRRQPCSSQCSRRRVPSGVAAGATVVGGQMFVGAGTGAFNEGADAEREATRDTPLSAFCVQGTPGCVTNTCNDGNACTYDYRDRQGTCVSEPGAEDLDCTVEGQGGHCAAGVCTLG